MSHTKKKSLKARIKSHLKLSHKKVSALKPREYTVMHGHPDYISFDPSGHSHLRGYSISHKVEKWILIVLLAFAVAAFGGFKLLENSDMSFSLTDPAKEQVLSAKSNSVSSESEFKTAFQNNRKEARALMQGYSPKYGKGTKKYYAKSKHAKKLVSKHSKKSSKKKC